jgi:hypothetical protein
VLSIDLYFSGRARFAFSVTPDGVILYDGSNLVHMTVPVPYHRTSASFVAGVECECTVVERRRLTGYITSGFYNAMQSLVYFAVVAVVGLVCTNQSQQQTSNEIKPLPFCV